MVTNTNSRAPPCQCRYSSIMLGQQRISISDSQGADRAQFIDTAPSRLAFSPAVRASKLLEMVSRCCRKNARWSLWTIGHGLHETRNNPKPSQRETFSQYQASSKEVEGTCPFLL